MDKLNIQTRHVAQVVCAFMSAATPLNVIKSFRSAGADVFLDDDRLSCRVHPGLARCWLNPATLQLMPMLEETEDEATETDMNLYADECCELLYDLDTSDPDDK
jgi:hypothetical protein